jgi:translocation and assembly module TamA
MRQPGRPGGPCTRPARPPAEESEFSLVTPRNLSSSRPTLGVRIDIDAPAELKALLEKHLDLVRLGADRARRSHDTEWSRLIDAAPAQVRDLLQTEGYFSPR